MGSRWVTSWYYEQAADEGGAYAQVRGESSSEDFRDVYRRCIALFFASARTANPDAKLVLFLNRAWREDATPTAARVADVLAQLGVEQVVLRYDSAPPMTWSPRWRNQFFVLDVLRWLAESSGTGDALTVMDSDIVWNVDRSSNILWSRLASAGSCAYRIDYSPDRVVNGMSLVELTRLGQSLMPKADWSELVNYHGGEFLALDHASCGQLVSHAGALWAKILKMHSSDRTLNLEEAHLLSLAFRGSSLRPVGADGIVKRLWTQPFRFRNVSPEDVELLLWHTPAEKRYGLRRLYASLDKDDAWTGTAAAHGFSSRSARTLGIPSNSTPKIVGDVATSIRGRLSRG